MKVNQLVALVQTLLPKASVTSVDRQVVATAAGSGRGARLTFTMSPADERWTAEVLVSGSLLSRKNWIAVDEAGVRKITSEFELLLEMPDHELQEEIAHQSASRELEIEFSDPSALGEERRLRDSANLAAAKQRTPQEPQLIARKFGGKGKP